MSMTLEQRKARLDEIDIQQRAMIDKANAEQSGKFTAEQKLIYDRLDAEHKELSVLPRRTHMNSNFPLPEGTSTPLSNSGWARTDTGESVPVYSPRDSMATQSSTGEPLSLGRFLQGRITGNWRLAENEFAALHAGLGTADGSGSSIMVPIELSGQFIDLARSASIVIGWGARTVDVHSDTMRIAGLKSDAAFSGVGENEKIPESTPSFRGIQLVPKKIGTIVRCSRELIEDAPNAPGIIEDALRIALGKELDRLFLVGTADEKGIIGLTNYPGIDDTGTSSIGAIEWSDLHNAVVMVKSRDFKPNGYVLSPTIGGDLDILRGTADGLWLGPPPSVSPLTRHETTSIGDALAIVGDGSKIIIGVRRQIQVDFSSEADEAFERDQILMRITCRVDMAVTHTGAFQVLRGITT